MALPPSGFVMSPNVRAAAKACADRTSNKWDLVQNSIRAVGRAALFPKVDADGPVAGGAPPSLERDLPPPAPDSLPSPLARGLSDPDLVAPPVPSEIWQRRNSDF